MDYFQEVLLLISTGKMTIDRAIEESERHLQLLDMARNRYFKYHDEEVWSVINWNEYERKLKSFIERLNHYKEKHGDPDVPVDLNALIEAEIKKQLEKKLPNPFGSLGEDWESDND